MTICIIIHNTTALTGFKLQGVSDFKMPRKQLFLQDISKIYLRLSVLAFEISEKCTWFVKVLLLCKENERFKIQAHLISKFQKI